MVPASSNHNSHGGHQVSADAASQSRLEHKERVREHKRATKRQAEMLIAALESSSESDGGEDTEERRQLREQKHINKLKKILANKIFGYLARCDF